MPNWVPSLTSALLAVNTLGYAVLLARLFWLGLYRLYPAFCVYLLLELVRNTVLHISGPATNLYAYTWLVTMPLSWVTAIFVVLELYRLVLRDFPGVSRLGARMIIALLVTSTFISLLSLSAEAGSATESNPVFRYMFTAGRAVSFTAVLFIVGITFFLAVGPIRVSRNVAVYSGLYCLYFLAETLGLFVANVTGGARQWIHLGWQLTTLLCVAGWLCLLHPAGEKQQVQGLAWLPDQQERLMRLLDSLNTALLRTARR